MSSLRIVSLCLIAALGLGCPPRAQPPEVPLGPSVSEFALSPGDTFDVRVFSEPDMTGSYRVAPDGTIDFPLIGQLRVEGLLPPEVAHTIQSRLKNGYLRNPQVSVLIKDQPSKKITVIGEVGKPGTFPYAPNMTIVEAISMAGGFTAMAKKNDTTVTRIESGQKHSVQVPVADISVGQAANYQLRPGDIISVPQRIF
jgi:protein involved in polysaccharide export with SLBB domain